MLLLTTLSPVRATVEAIRTLREQRPQPVALQDHHIRAGREITQEA